MHFRSSHIYKLPCHRIAADDDEDNDSVSNSAFFDEDNNSNSVNLAATGGASEDSGAKDASSLTPCNVGRKNKRKNFRPRNILTSGGDENANGGEVPGGGGGGVAIGVGEEQGWISMPL